jgi:hypothetical protein
MIQSPMPVEVMLSLSFNKKLHHFSVVCETVIAKKLESSRMEFADESALQSVKIGNLNKNGCCPQF